MLLLNTTVPEALILKEPNAVLPAKLVAQGAHWFAARPEHATLSEDPVPAIQMWRSRTSDLVMQKTHPNRNNSAFRPESQGGGIEFISGKHCGFYLSNVTLNAQKWSCALRFEAPQNSARTLLTLNSGTVDNYMFLQQIMGQVIFKDQKSTLEITAAQDPTSRPVTTLYAAFSDQRLWLRVDKGPVQTTGTRADIPLTNPLTLYIGCRSNKARLLKTLGHFFLHDAILWPDTNILDLEHKGTLDLFDHPELWGARA